MVEVKGEIKGDLTVDAKGTQTLIDAAVDLFSPATELLGLLGDAVRLARVEVAARITRRAKEIADENQLHLSAPPLKFLVPFYEKALLEEPNDGEAHERWAQLLVAASTGNASHPLFTTLMSQINGDQARLLREIFFGKGKAPKKDESVVGEQFNGVTGKFHRGLCNHVLHEVEKTKSFNKLFDSFSYVFTNAGVTTSGMSLMGMNVSMRDSMPKEKRLSAISKIDSDVLESLGLVQFHEFESPCAVSFFDHPEMDKVDEKLKEHLKEFDTFFEVTIITISDLGINFLCAFDKDARDYLTTKITDYEKRHSRRREE